MPPVLDCFVVYFGRSRRGQPTYRQYYCYQLVAVPGLTSGSGAAVITLLAVHDPFSRGTLPQKLYAVDEGGPEAALAEAVRSLDDWHRRDRFCKAQSASRALSTDQPLDASSRQGTGVGKHRWGAEAASPLVERLHIDTEPHKSIVAADEPGRSASGEFLASCALFARTTRASNAATGDGSSASAIPWPTGASKACP